MVNCNLSVGSNQSNEKRPKILLTVGTTNFDGLVEAFDINNPDFDFTFQIANGKYIPNTGVWYRFVDDFSSFIQDFDLIITHAGAGTVYSLLEMKKKLMVVPNIQRNDHHQLELSTYLDQNSFAYVTTLETLRAGGIIGAIRDSLNFKAAKFLKDSFFRVKEIVDFFDG